MQSPLDNIPMFVSVPTTISFIYAFVMLLYWTGSFFILYHLIRFGVSGQPKKMAVTFLVGSLILSIVTTLFFAQVMFQLN